MLTLSRLRLRNWKCFRGEAVLDLAETTYAVVAREEGNAERSNFLGKTSLVEAVAFALYGTKPKDARRKVDWVSRGEKSGEVEVVLSDGTRIVRSQSLSGSEKLFLFPPDVGEGAAYQGEAQGEIDRILGLGEDDFGVSRLFRQGEMAKLVALDPGPRLDLVAGWLRLEAVQGCEDDALALLRSLVRARDEKVARARAADEEADGAAARAGVGGGTEANRLAAFEGKIEAAEVEEAEARAAVEEAEAALAKERARSDLLDAAAAYERVVEEGKKLAAETKDVDRAALARAAEEADAEREGAAGAVAEAAREATTKVRLQVGEFDRVCPLVGAECPSAEFVMRTGRGNVEATRAAEERLRVARAAAEAARGRAAEATLALSRHDEKLRRLERLRGEVRRLKPSYEKWLAIASAGESAPIGAFEEKLLAARERLSSATGNLGALRACLAQYRGALARAALAREDAGKLDSEVRVAAAAAEVFGKNGAQRRLAEGALSEIEDLACSMLSRAGIPLSVRVSWARESTGLAHSCRECGEAFPKSERVKACSRCGAARGPHLVSKLEIEPSASSGGARDLVGIFVQLAAASWLCEDRGARLGTAMLDEPTAAIDAYMRRAFSSHLPELLRASGVRQALVVAHHASVLDALPARIEVVSRDGWSTATVVS